MTNTAHPANLVAASFEEFERYLTSYRIELADVAPNLHIEIAGDDAIVTGLPIVDGFQTLDLTKRKLTKRLPLPLGLQCEVLLCSGTLISGIDNLPAGLGTLDLSRNTRLKKLPARLPEHLDTLIVSRTKVATINACPPKLRILDCGFGEVEMIEPLPLALEEFRCSGNSIAMLPTLPDTLNILECYGNPLPELPQLPAGLRELDWRTSGVDTIAIPTLPAGLRTLSWSHPHADCSAPELPASLAHLSILLFDAIELPPQLESLSLDLDPGVAIAALPASIEALWYSGSAPLPNPLPAALRTLSCGRNGFTSVPPLPPLLTSFTCEHNELSTLPELPPGLEVLWCSNNQLTELPALPDTLREFNCEGNQLTQLPELSTSLIHLWCNDNRLSSLPQLDRWWDDIDTSKGYDSNQGLRRIHCQNNQIASMPTLPKGLNELRCQHNVITEMPPIPLSTAILNCSHNKLTSLTSLPPKINQLFCNNNPHLSVIDTYESEAFDRLHKSNATAIALDDATKERLRSWGLRTD